MNLKKNILISLILINFSATYCGKNFEKKCNFKKQKSIFCDLKLRKIYNRELKNVYCPQSIKSKNKLPLQSIKKPEDIEAPFSGFFYGIHASLSHFSAQNNYVNTNPHKQTYPNYKGIESITDNGTGIGTHVTYGHCFINNIYLGGEITASYNIIKGTLSNETYFDKTLTYQQKDSYGVLLRMGKNIENILVYGKSGIVFTKRVFDSNYPDLKKFKNAPGYETYNEYYTSKKYIKAFVIGFGGEFFISKKISLGLETEYIQYEKEKISHKWTQDYSINANNFNMKIKTSIKFLIFFRKKYLKF
jgi:opacity protein-like surface antigen